MYYQLFETANPAEPLARGHFDDDFTAENWARDWARRKGDIDDYLIRRIDGGLSSQLFRTHAGQWYIMRQ
jgi:hypothetical protein